jgi:hypothetical protein
LKTPYILLHARAGAISAANVSALLMLLPLISPLSTLRLLLLLASSISFPAPFRQLTSSEKSCLAAAPSTTDSSAVLLLLLLLLLLLHSRVSAAVVQLRAASIRTCTLFL